MPPSKPSPEDFGRDIWRYLRGGRRVLIQTVRTIKPTPSEEADRAAFEARMALMVERLLADPAVASVDTDFERRSGKSFLCTVTVRYAEETAPDASAETPATGITTKLDGFGFGAFGLAAA